MKTFLFGHPSGFAARYQGLMVAGVLFCICTVDYLMGLA